MDQRKQTTEPRENEAPRRRFVAPRLKQHEKLPEITAASGDFCDLFPGAPGC